MHRVICLECFTLAHNCYSGDNNGDTMTIKPALMIRMMIINIVDSTQCLCSYAVIMDLQNMQCLG